MLGLVFASSSLVPSRPAVQSNSRRAALAAVPRFALGAAALSTAPLVAKADSIEEIAARANQKAKAEREATFVAPPPEVQSDEDKLKPIIAAVGASVVLSVPFYAENLKRLATKISSGGEDTGYAKKDTKRGKGKPKPKKGGATAGGFFNAAASAAFRKEKPPPKRR